MVLVPFALTPADVVVDRAVRWLLFPLPGLLIETFHPLEELRIKPYQIAVAMTTNIDT